MGWQGADEGATIHGWLGTFASKGLRFYSIGDREALKNTRRSVRFDLECRASV
jgi:hypothetical protein